MDGSIMGWMGAKRGRWEHKGIDGSITGWIGVKRGGR